MNSKRVHDSQESNVHKDDDDDAIGLIKKKQKVTEDGMDAKDIDMDAQPMIRNYTFHAPSTITAPIQIKQTQQVYYLHIFPLLLTISNVYMIYLGCNEKVPAPKKWITNVTSLFP